MANLKSGLILGEDEHLVVELEAELWAASSNPIAQLIGAVVKFLNLLLGNNCGDTKNAVKLIRDIQ